MENAARYHGRAQFYSLIIQADKPGIYELRMIQQSDDGASRKVVISIIAEAT